MPGKWSKYWKKPEGKLTWISLVLAVIFGLFALYSHFVSKEIRGISYTYKTYKLYDSKHKNPAVRVSDAQGVLIAENVYVSEFILWNSGNKDLDAVLIREPISIGAKSLPPNFRILSAQISKGSHLASSQFKLDADSGISVRISWEHFDASDGLNIRITYRGEKEVEWRTTGNVAGARVDEFAPRREDWGLGSLIFALGIALVSFPLTILFLWKVLPEFPTDVRNRRWGEAVSTILIALFLFGATAGSSWAVWVYFVNQGVPNFPDSGDFGGDG